MQLKTHREWGNLARGGRILKAQGFHVISADAECFDLGRTFDVIVAGDIIEHLGDLNGFRLRGMGWNWAKTNLDRAICAIA